MTNESVKSDVAVSSSVQNVQIWSVEQIGGSESDFEVVFTVTQTISDGRKRTAFPARMKPPSTRTAEVIW